MNARKIAIEICAQCDMWMMSARGICHDNEYCSPFVQRFRSFRSLFASEFLHEKRIYFVCVCGFSRKTPPFYILHHHICLKHIRFNGDATKWNQFHSIWLNVVGFTEFNSDWFRSIQPPPHPFPTSIETLNLRRCLLFIAFFILLFALPKRITHKFHILEFSIKFSMEFSSKNVKKSVKKKWHALCHAFGQTQKKLLMCLTMKLRKWTKKKEPSIIQSI